MKKHWKKHQKHQKTRHHFRLGPPLSFKSGLERRISSRWDVFRDRPPVVSSREPHGPVHARGLVVGHVHTLKAEDL